MQFSFIDPCLVHKVSADAEAFHADSQECADVLFIDAAHRQERDMGQRVARSLVMPQMLELMSLTGDSKVAEMMLPEKWQKRTLEEINVRRNFGVTVLAVRRGEETLTSLRADFLLLPGDVLLMLGTASAIDALDQ